jgi:hypothetical protein
MTTIWPKLSGPLPIDSGPRKSDLLEATERKTTILRVVRCILETLVLAPNYEHVLGVRPS